MYNLLLIPTFAPGLDPGRRTAATETLSRAVAALPDTLSALCAPTLPGVYNGGDLLCRLVFSDADACAAALGTEAWRAAEALLADPERVEKVERVAYAGGQAGGDSAGAGLYRVALFCANVRPDAERLAAFAAETAAMPNTVRSILRWQLSQADNAQGTRAWTHVWEQEYRDLDGLNGPYMLHPAHWARVERWFDPEYPEHLVDSVLVHTFCAIDRPVILS